MMVKNIIKVIQTTAKGRLLARKFVFLGSIFGTKTNNANIKTMVTGIMSKLMNTVFLEPNPLAMPCSSQCMGKRGKSGSPCQIHKLTAKTMNKQIQLMIMAVLVMSNILKIKPIAKPNNGLSKIAAGSLFLEKNTFDGEDMHNRNK